MKKEKETNTEIEHTFDEHSGWGTYELAKLAVKLFGVDMARVFKVDDGSGKWALAIARYNNEKAAYTWTNAEGFVLVHRNIKTSFVAHAYTLNELWKKAVAVSKRKKVTTSPDGSVPLL